VILLTADGLSGAEIAGRLGLSVGQISRIRRRFELGGVAGLEDRPRAGRRDHAVPKEKIELIARLVTSMPPVGFARWSTRLLGARVGLSSATVAKLLRAGKPARALTLEKSR
jgi:transposase